MQNKNEYHVRECTSCEGSGGVQSEAETYMQPPAYDQCHDCSGSGYEDHGETCIYCHELLRGHTVEDGNEAAHWACYEKHNSEA